MYMAMQQTDDETFKSVSMCVEDVARWFLFLAVKLFISKSRQNFVILLLFPKILLKFFSKL